MKLIEFNWFWHIYVPKPWKMLGLKAARWLASMRWMFVASKAWNCIIHKASSFAQSPPLLRPTLRTRGCARVWQVILSVRHSIYIHTHPQILQHELFSLISCLIVLVLLWIVSWCRSYFSKVSSAFSCKLCFVPYQDLIFSELIRTALHCTVLIHFTEPSQGAFMRLGKRTPSGSLPGTSKSIQAKWKLKLVCVLNGVALSDPAGLS